MPGPLAISSTLSNRPSETRQKLQRKIHENKRIQEQKKRLEQLNGRSCLTVADSIKKTASDVDSTNDGKLNDLTKSKNDASEKRKLPQKPLTPQKPILPKTLAGTSQASMTVGSQGVTSVTGNMSQVPTGGKTGQQQFLWISPPNQSVLILSPVSGSVIQQGHTASTTKSSIMATASSCPSTNTNDVQQSSQLVPQKSSAGVFNSSHQEGLSGPNNISTSFSAANLHSSMSSQHLQITKPACSVTESIVKPSTTPLNSSGIMSADTVGKDNIHIENISILNENMEVKKFVTGRKKLVTSISCDINNTSEESLIKSVPIVSANSVASNTPILAQQLSGKDHLFNNNLLKKDADRLTAFSQSTPFFADSLNNNGKSLISNSPVVKLSSTPAQAIVTSPRVQRSLNSTSKTKGNKNTTPMKNKFSAKRVADLLKEKRGYGPQDDTFPYVNDRRPVCQLLRENREKQGSQSGSPTVMYQTLLPNSSSPTTSTTLVDTSPKQETICGSPPFVAPLLLSCQNKPDKVENTSENAPYESTGSFVRDTIKDDSLKFSALEKKNALAKSLSHEDRAEAVLRGLAKDGLKQVLQSLNFRSSSQKQISSVNNSTTFTSTKGLTGDPLPFNTKVVSALPAVISTSSALRVPTVIPRAQSEPWFADKNTFSSNTKKNSLTRSCHSSQLLAKLQQDLQSPCENKMLSNLETENILDSLSHLDEISPSIPLFSQQVTASNVVSSHNASTEINQSGVKSYVQNAPNTSKSSMSYDSFFSPPKVQRDTTADDLNNDYAQGIEHNLYMMANTGTEASSHFLGSHPGSENSSARTSPVNVGFDAHHQFIHSEETSPTNILSPHSTSSQPSVASTPMSILSPQANPQMIGNGEDGTSPFIPIPMTSGSQLNSEASYKPMDTLASATLQQLAGCVNSDVPMPLSFIPEIAHNYNANDSSAALFPTPHAATKRHENGVNVFGGKLCKRVRNDNQIKAGSSKRMRHHSAQSSLSMLRNSTGMGTQAVRQPQLPCPNLQQLLSAQPNQYLKQQSQQQHVVMENTNTSNSLLYSQEPMSPFSPEINDIMSCGSHGFGSSLSNVLRSHSVPVSQMMRNSNDSQDQDIFPTGLEPGDMHLDSHNGIRHLLHDKLQDTTLAPARGIHISCEFGARKNLTPLLQEKQPEDELLRQTIRGDCMISGASVSHLRKVESSRLMHKSTNYAEEGVCTPSASQATSNAMSNELPIGIDQTLAVRGSEIFRQGSATISTSTMQTSDNLVSMPPSENPDIPLNENFFQSDYENTTEATQEITSAWMMNNSAEY